MHRRRSDVGAFIFGGILLLVGVYYLLQQTLGMALPDLDWDRIWPLILIVIGGLVLFGAWSRRQEG
jgi:ABC-type antimicrobial peptide transport system permease subunit